MLFATPGAPNPLYPPGYSGYSGYLAEPLNMMKLQQIPHMELPRMSNGEPCQRKIRAWACIGVVQGSTQAHLGWQTEL